MLTPDAIAFVNELAERFARGRDELLARREARQRQFDAGALPDFPDETRQLRESDWKVGAIPADLLDRRVEITGPTDRKMVINALNSGAKVFMADFEDSLSPTWDNVIEGQINLRDAVRAHAHARDAGGQAVPAQRQDGRAGACGRAAGTCRRSTCCMATSRSPARSSISASTCSTTPPSCSRAAPGRTSTCRSSRTISRRGSGPTSSSTPSALLGLPRGTIKVTVLIETIPAAFEMDEILHELRDYIVGLNCGRWDYIFSFIKKFGHRPEFVLPDRGRSR